MIIRKAVDSGRGSQCGIHLSRSRAKGDAAWKKALLFIMAVILTVFMMPLPIWANAAEPPSLVILVNDPPEDLSIVLISDEEMPEATVRKVAWEGYYAFYSRDLEKEGRYVFQVSAGQDQFEWSPDEALQGYNNVYTLNVSEQVFTPGLYPLRAVLLVSIRVALTLLIEGLVFLLFRFREKRSWMVFLAVNLLTQGALNIWLNNGGSLMPSYLLFALVIGEVFVLVTEMIALPLLIEEHKKSRILVFAIVANLASLVAGGYIIFVLPV